MQKSTEIYQATEDEVISTFHDGWSLFAMHLLLNGPCLAFNPRRSLECEVTDRHIQMKTIPMAQGERPIRLTRDQKAIYPLLQADNNLREAVSRKLHNNSEFYQPTNSAFQKHNAIRPRSVNIYQLETKKAKSLLLLEGQIVGKEGKLHKDINETEIHKRLLKEGARVKSGHIWLNLLLLDYWSQNTPEPSDIDQLEKRMELTCIANGLICLGTDGAVMMNNRISNALKVQERELVPA